MSDRTQTLSVELEREEIERLADREEMELVEVLGREESLLRATGPVRTKLGDKLRSALSQSGDYPSEAELYPEFTAKLEEEQLREAVHKAIEDWAIQPQCDKLGAHEVDEATDAVLAALPAQPPAPVLSDEERERLENIALSLLGRGYHEPAAEQAAFLRNLASQEHRGEGGVGAGVASPQGPQGASRPHLSASVDPAPIQGEGDDYAKRCKDELAALPDPPGIPPGLFCGAISQGDQGRCTPECKRNFDGGESSERCDFCPHKTDGPQEFA